MVAVGGRSRVAGAWLRCVCACACVFVFVYCVVPCHVVCHASLLFFFFFACRSSRVVSCRLSFVVLCSVVLCCFGLCCVVCVVVCVGEGEGCIEHAPSSLHVYVQNALRVYQHHVHMFYTCGLGAGTHGDVLNVHTGHTTPQPQPHNNTQQHTTHNDTTTTHNQPTCG